MANAVTLEKYILSKLLDSNTRAVIIIAITTVVMASVEYFPMSQALQLTVQMHYLPHFSKYHVG